MDKDTKISIGIQARSTSSRLPGKISRSVGSRTVLERVVDAADSCASYINRYSFSNRIHCGVYILVPEGDIIVDQLHMHRDKILEGDENDVLSRYVKLQKETNADFIVRVTADCPVIPHFLIYKGVNVAVKNGLDCVSNVADLKEEMRVSIDGHDIEVLSKRALAYLDQYAKGSDREHVTSLLRKLPPPEDLRFGGLFGHVDFCHPYFKNVKLSIDTEEDLKRVAEMHESLEEKISKYKSVYGKNSVYRF